ncbi:MAG TPA: hypothetical protein PLO45_01265 [Defluviitoga sp.]|nr:hypothetical protein [Defluviitoga sp.]
MYIKMASFSKIAYKTLNLSYNFLYNINYDVAMLSMIPLLSFSQYMINKEQ